IIVSRRSAMPGRDDGQNAACVGKGRFRGFGALAEGAPQIAPPHVRIAVGIVEMPAPDSRSIQIFLPIPARPKRSVRVAAPVARNARSAPPFERKRLANIHPIAAAEAKRPRISRRGTRIAPQQQPLRAGPDAMRYFPLAILSEQVAVSIAQEAARAAAESHQRA